MMAQVAALTEALQTARVPLPKLSELEIQRDLRRGKAKGTGADQERLIGPNPSKIVLGGNDLPREQADMRARLSSLNGRDLRMALDQKYLTKRDDLSMRSESVNNKDLLQQFEQLLKELKSDLRKVQGKPVSDDNKPDEPPFT